MTSTGPETSETPGATTQRHGFGIDVGGSGIKGGIVDLDTGQLIGDRIKLLTPQPATCWRSPNHRRGRQRFRLAGSAGGDLSRRRHSRRRPDRG